MLQTTNDGHKGQVSHSTESKMADFWCVLFTSSQSAFYNGIPPKFLTTDYVYDISEAQQKREITYLKECCAPATSDNYIITYKIDVKLISSRDLQCDTKESPQREHI